MRCRGLAVPVVLGLWTLPATAQHNPNKERLVGQPGTARPWTSPPGWFGPGPARANDFGPGTGWQYYGLPNGPFVYGGANWGGYPYGRFGRYPFPGFYGFSPPGAFGSFWTNGRSLYGPPVPTYGPTPGVFGASDDDKRFFTNPPPASAVFFGLGWAGGRSPSPRHLPYSVSVNPLPVLPPSVVVLDGPPVSTTDGHPCLRIAVRLPDPAATVWVENKEMKQTGMERLFESPPLEDGQSYRYRLIARWTENGQEKAESRAVVAKAGQSVSVDFTRPDDTAAGQ